MDEMETSIEISEDVADKLDEMVGHPPFEDASREDILETVIWAAAITEGAKQWTMWHRLIDYNPKGSDG